MSWSCSPEMASCKKQLIFLLTWSLSQPSPASPCLGAILGAPSPPCFCSGGTVGRVHAQPTPFIGIVPIHLCYFVHNAVKITAGGRGGGICPFFGKCIPGSGAGCLLCIYKWGCVEVRSALSTLTHKKQEHKYATQSAGAPRCDGMWTTKVGRVEPCLKCSSKPGFQWIH